MCRTITRNGERAVTVTDSYRLSLVSDFQYSLHAEAAQNSVMAQDFALATDSSSRATETWWAGRRLRYNIGLLIAGPLGFSLYAVVVSRCIDLRAPSDWEITALTTVFQGFAYLVMIGVANLCYYFGPWSNRLVRPANVATYRKIVFRFGFWFCLVALPTGCSSIRHLRSPR